MTVTRRSTLKLDRTPRPRILVLESWGSAERCVAASGGIPLTTSPQSVGDTVRALEVGMFDGLLLVGGGDIDPRRYGARPHKSVYGVNETRDELELLALDVAAEIGVPVMGICRGAQMIAVHNGGKLRQHINGHRGGSHLVITEDGSLAQDATGFRQLKCVSLHHQMIENPGAGFRITGRAIDRTVEIIESADGRCLGVQYHPEMDYRANEASANAFDWLVDKAAEKAGIAFPETPYRPPLELPRKKGKAKAKNRSAGTRSYSDPGAKSTKLSQQTGLLPKRTGDAQRRFDSSVSVSWLCPHCAMRFDDVDDREMHVSVIHGLPTDHDHAEWQARGQEPPPGHPDWEDDLLFDSDAALQG